jgi:hypothetical protein
MLPKWLVNMTELVNIAKVRAHWQSTDQGTMIVWVCGHIVGRLMDQIFD